MYTLKGLFPEPKKEPQKNFIKENVRQLKSVPNKGNREPKFTVNRSYSPKAKLTGSGSSMSQVKGSPSKKSNKLGRKSIVQIKKGDMAEFLRRKETRQQKVQQYQESDEDKSSTSSGRLRDIACQTLESNFANQDTVLTLLYPKEEDGKLKASGDMNRKVTPSKTITPRRNADMNLLDPEKRTRVTAILERKESNKDPYLPSGYQKGVLPKYLRERKEQSQKEVEGYKAEGDDTVCPPGHVALPDNERKETLRMLRNSFAEFVNELNKLPVKTDTLKMRNRKMELEKQLAKLEEGIKVFSRQKVFVKIGE